MRPLAPIRIETVDKVYQTPGVVELHADVTRDPNTGQWSISSIEKVIEDDDEEFYPLFLRVGPPSSLFQDIGPIDIGNGYQRIPVRGQDGYWYMADETDTFPDVLHVIRNDTRPLPPDNGGGSPPTAPLGSGGGTPLSSSSRDGAGITVKNGVATVLSFVGGIVVGFFEGGWNFVTSTVSGIVEIGKFGIANWFEWHPLGRLAKKGLRIVAPGIDMKLDPYTIKAKDIIKMAETVEKMVLDSKIYHAISTGSWEKVKATFAEEFRTLLKIGSLLVKTAWQEFMRKNAYEKGKVFGELIFEVVTWIFPYLKDGQAAKAGALIGKFAGLLGKIKFLESIPNLVTQSVGFFKKFPKFAKTLVQAVKTFLGLCCFERGTPVLTREGIRPIENVRPGDWVLSRNPLTGWQGYRPVTCTFTSQVTTLYHIRYHYVRPREPRTPTQRATHQ